MTIVLSTVKLRGFFFFVYLGNLEHPVGRPLCFRELWRNEGNVVSYEGRQYMLFATFLNSPQKKECWDGSYLAQWDVGMDLAGR